MIGLSLLDFIWSATTGGHSMVENSSMMGAMMIVWMPLLGIICGALAWARGRNAIGWGITTAVLLGPLAPIFLLVMRPWRPGVEAQLVKAGELRRCPTCAELVRIGALKCRFCLAELTEPE